MHTGDVILAALEGNQRFVDNALDGLTPEQATRQLSKDSNHIDWLAWHMARAEDAILSSILGQPQVWTTEGWHKKWGMPDDPGKTGGGDTPDQVAAFRSPNLATLRSYMAAVRKRTKEYLKNVTPAELDRVTVTRRGEMKVGAFLGRWLVDQLHHSGQIAFLRGIVTGGGWMPH